MTDIIDQLQAAMHAESAALAPMTSEAIEAMRAAQVKITRLRAENDRLRDIFEQIDDELVQAAVDDCESGVKWLNERAAENYLREYRHTKDAIHKVIDLARAARAGASDE